MCYFDIQTGRGSLLRVDDTHNHSLDEIFGNEIFLKQSMDTYIDSYVHEEDKELMRQAVDAERIKSIASERADAG